MLNRRDALKVSGVAALGLVAADKSFAKADSPQPAISVAGYPYDRVQAIKDGGVGLDKAQVTFSNENIYRLNDLAFGPEKYHEVTELGLIPYVTKYINEGFRGYTLIPVFISRTFRHRNIYVHVDSGIEKPQDLRGRKVGTPGYGASSNTWIRGMLQDQYGVFPQEMQWIETTRSSDKAGTVNSSSGGSFQNGKLSLYLPADFPLVQGPPGVDESELLLSGGCDALVTAITPKAFEEGNPKIRQLFTQPKAAEQAYYRDTGLFPIMHVVAIRSDAAKEKPWLAAAVFQMYSQAKQLAYGNLAGTTVLRTSLPWAADEYEETRQLMGDDYWRYGIEANREELELIMRYTHEQGLVKRLGGFEEMFDPSTIGLAG
ncbi:MAG: ABC transporter substrate-binding protein [Halioglobus sp.]